MSGTADEARVKLAEIPFQTTRERSLRPPL